MSDQELELDLDLEEEPNINRSEQRIKNLSSKVKEQAQETATEREAREKAETRADAAEKKAEFLESFAGVAAKFPNASEYREAIQEKVLSGYSVEDATVAVLNTEGKLLPQDQTTEAESALGGSASMPPLGGEQKSTNDMTLDEKRAKLMEADQRGELAEALRGF